MKTSSASTNNQFSLTRAALTKGGYAKNQIPAISSVRLLAGVVCLLAFCFEGAAFPNKEIKTAGPIKKITVGEDGSLQVEYQGYPGIGQFFPKGVSPADCGFFLRHNGKVVGINYLGHENTAASSTKSVGFHCISQTLSTDGQMVGNVMDNSTDGTGVPFKVTQYVSYSPGNSWLTVTVIVKNESASAQTVDFFAAADIYLADEDRGYPYLNTVCPQVAIGGANANRTFNVFVQAAPGDPQPTSYQEDFFLTIWSIIGNGEHFANTTTADYLDNGAGLEWKDVTIPAGGSKYICYLWAFGTVTCVDPTTGAKPAIHIMRASNMLNLVLYWDQPGYFLQVSTNSLGNWDPNLISVTNKVATFDIDSQKHIQFYRLVRP
jgi:hypothetical protein